MMSKTFLNRQTINMSLFTVRKNIGLFILSVAAVLMLCPGFYLVRMDEYQNYSIDLVWVLAALLTIGAGVLVMFYNFLNFLFLYSKKSSDVFHALPLTRSQLLVSRWFSGVVMTLVPVVIGYLALAIIFLCLPLHRGDIGMIFGCMAYTVMTVLVCSAFSMIFIICAGSAFDLVLCFIGVNGGLLLAGLVVMALMNNTLIGASNDVNYKVYENISPFWYCGAGLVRFINNDCVFVKGDIWYFVRTAFYTVVSLLASIALYNRRKAERGGDAYAFRFIYIVCSVVVGFVASYVIGYVFTGDGIDPLFWLFAVLGALLFAVAFGAITDRGFKYYKRSLVVGAGSVTILATIALIFVGGCFGFTTRIPEKSDIKSVTVRYSGEDVVYTDPTLPLEIHKTFIDRIDSLTYAGDSYMDTSYVYYTYELKDGTKMERTYYVSVEEFSEELLKLYTSDERLYMMLTLLEKGKPTSAEISGYFEIIDNEGRFAYHEQDGYASAYMTPAEIKGLIEAYRKDIKNADVSIIVDNEANISINWNQNGGYHSYEYFNLRVDDSFKNTLEYLRSLRLSDRVEQMYEDQYKK